MATPVNASPTKVYVLLFLVVVIAYGIFIITKSLKKSNVDMEHFVEENPDYKYRLEVMKVFDLYMNRNPTPEEIEKYAAIKNEQDILLTILKDFNITASDIKKAAGVQDEEATEKLLGAVRVEEEFGEVAVASDDEDDDTLPANLDIEKLVNETRETSGIIKVIDTYKDATNTSEIRITRKEYDELRAKIAEIHSAVESYNRISSSPVVSSAKTTA